MLSESLDSGFETAMHGSMIQRVLAQRWRYKSPPVNEKQHQSFPLSFAGAALLTLTFAAALLYPTGASTGQQGQQHETMPGMAMRNHDEMSDMGPSMAAMAGHMYMTPLRPKQPGDQEKAKAVV